jgi:hypothetical protein
VSIPEVGSRSRLLAFLSKYLGLSTDRPQRIHTTDNIALSASAVSVSASPNTIKAIGKWPLQLHQNQADGYGLYIKRDNDTDAESYPLTWVRELNASSTEAVLRVDQYSEVLATGPGYGTAFEVWTPGPSGLNCSLWVDNRGILRMGGDQGTGTASPNTHMVELKTTSYFESETFTGTGLNDLTPVSDGYQGTSKYGTSPYRVQIDSNGTPDTFKWSTDGGLTWVATGVNCSTSVTSLQDGIYVKFGATTGHTIGDYWDIVVRILHPLRIKNAAGTTFLDVRNDSSVQISGHLQLPNQPAVYAWRTSTQDFNPNTDPETIIFNDASTTEGTAFDVGSDYNTTTGIFTAPADGKYLVQASALLYKVPTDSIVLIYCESTNSAADSIKMYSNRIDPDLMAGSTDPIDYLFVEGTWLVNMDENDTAQIYAHVTTGDSATKIYGATNNQYTRIQIIKVA